MFIFLNIIHIQQIFCLDWLFSSDENNAQIFNFTSCDKKKTFKKMVCHRIKNGNFEVFFFNLL